MHGSGAAPVDAFSSACLQASSRGITLRRTYTCTRIPFSRLVPGLSFTSRNLAKDFAGKNGCSRWLPYAASVGMEVVTIGFAVRCSHAEKPFSECIWP